MENLRRSYEISVWTLQDSFITVLKPSNLEFKGQIVDPLMNIKDDGENKLSLKIPMYIRNDSGEIVENSLWCNTRNGTIIVDLRKLKVIFNKATTSEEVFEFLITKVQEEHEGLKKYCQVECEGLAFHELGKQGYKIALEGGNEIEIEQKKYFDGESKYTVCPQPTINYWADRVFKNSNWRYSIQMDWSAHDGITHQIYDELDLDSDNYSSFSIEQRNVFNSWRAENGLRRRDRVYEDSFVSAWEYDEDTNKLTPKTITEEREKYRLVEASESNRYNLSQTIAETFQVYCKYKYYYDDNYHIIDREVIFYNNFLNESQGVIDLTYKYNTEHLTRIMDATDTVSKMYVRPLNDGDAPGGEALISDADANKSKEDYLLNFDYLYNIGTITQEQYDEIEPYYAKLHEKNEQYHLNSEKLATKEKEKTKQEARKTTAEDAIALDTENISNNDAIARNVADDNGNILVTVDNAQMLYLIPEGGDKKTYYCNFKSQGIVRDSIKLYWDKPLNEDTEITQYNIENDEFGEVSKVVNINKGKDANSYIYATFSYSPNTYFKKVSEIYGIRLGQDQAIFNDASNQVTDLERQIAKLTDEQNTLLEEKAKIISDFENMMGPALREGTWQPEDEYSNYGEVYEKEIQLTNEDDSTDDILSLGWDNELFDDEQDFHYQYGATLQDRYYPCIEITSGLLDKLVKGDYDIIKFLAQLNLIYKNSESGTDQRTKQYIAINSKMKIAFLRNIKEEDKNTEKYNKVVPVLMITDAATMDREQLDLLRKTAYLTYIIPNKETGKIDEAVDSDNRAIKFEVNQWLISPPKATLTDEQLKTYYDDIGKNYEIVYPRFKINSPFVKSPYTMITVKQQSGKTKENEIKWELLANYENFYILPRTNYYTVTIKPETIFSSIDLNLSDAQSPFLKYKIYFTISMSPLAIYLDAVQVLKENSFPKVSYEIDVMSVNEEFVYSDYSRLGQIAHINDYEFKFENTLGYISELDLDLDKPWQDKAVIKNYKTKFEDIFSTIVAQTEQMKKNSEVIAMAASAFNSDGTLSSSILGESLMSEILARAADNTTDGNVPSPATEFMKYDPLIRNELRQTFNEAGKVLAEVNKSVEDVIGLNLNNADILGSFRIKVAENMTPTLFRLGIFKIDGKEVKYSTRIKINTVTGESEENESFKVGDILEYGQKIGQNYIIDTFLATTNSNQVDYTGDVDEQGNTIPKGQSFRGWSQTYDGSLAQIKGASLNIDAKKGEISLLAENKIDIKSKAELNLSSGKISIVGNNEVEIGGPDIKIYAASTDDLSKGIHLYSTVLGAQSVTSAVDITGNGIEMRASQGINFISSSDDGKDIAVISLSKDKGIYLGSNQPIKFFSGDFSSGASAEISKDRILFGVSNNADSTTAVDLTKDYIIFGAGSIVNSTNKKSIGSTQAGVQITKDAIKMASSNAANRSYFVLDKDKIEFGAANSSSTGAFIKLAQNGQVTIGVGGSKVVTDASTGFKSISNTDTTAKFEVYAPNFIVTSDGYLHANNANISGTIRATAGEIGSGSSKIKIGSSTVGSNIYSAIYSGSKNSLTSTYTGFYIGTNGIALGAAEHVKHNGSWQYMSPFQVDTNGNLYARSATVTGSITATSGEIGGWQIDGSSIHTKDMSITSNDTNSAGLSSSTFTRTINGTSRGSLKFAIGSNFGITNTGKAYASNVEISGTITATGGSIGGWTIGKTAQEHSYITTSTSRTEYNSSSKGMTLDANGIGAFESDKQYFTLSTTGILTAYNANINGTINSESGKIGGWYIGSNYIGNKDSFEDSTIGLYNKPNNDSDDGMNIELPDEIDIDINDDGNGEIDWGGDGDIVTNNTSDNKTTKTYITLWAGSQEKQNANFRVYANGSVNAGDLYAKSGKLTGNLIVENSLSLKGRLRLEDIYGWKIIFDRNPYYTTLYNITLRNGVDFSIRHGSSDRFIFYPNNLLIRYDDSNQISLSSSGISITGDVTISKDLDVRGKIKINGSEIRQFPSNGITDTFYNIPDMDTFSIDFDNRKWTWKKEYTFVFKNGLLT